MVTSSVIWHENSLCLHTSPGISFPLFSGKSAPLMNVSGGCESGNIERGRIESAVGREGGPFEALGKMLPGKRLIFLPRLFSPFPTAFCILLTRREAPKRFGELRGLERIACSSKERRVEVMSSIER